MQEVSWVLRALLWYYKIFRPQSTNCFFCGTWNVFQTWDCFNLCWFFVRLGVFFGGIWKFSTPLTATILKFSVSPFKFYREFLCKNLRNLRVRVVKSLGFSSSSFMDEKWSKVSVKRLERERYFSRNFVASYRFSDNLFRPERDYAPKPRGSR